MVPVSGWREEQEGVERVRERVGRRWGVEREGEWAASREGRRGGRTGERESRVGETGGEEQDVRRRTGLEQRLVAYGREHSRFSVGSLSFRRVGGFGKKDGSSSSSSLSAGEKHGLRRDVGERERDRTREVEDSCSRSGEDGRAGELEQTLPDPARVRANGSSEALNPVQTDCHAFPATSPKWGVSILQKEAGQLVREGWEEGREKHTSRFVRRPFFVPSAAGEPVPSLPPAPLRRRPE